MRLSYGPLALGTLLPGEIEEVGPRVIREQLADYIAPENLPKGDRPQFAKGQSVAAPHEAAEGARRREARRGPGPVADRPPPRQPSARQAPSRAKAGAEPPAKTTYKPGWAKPKPKAGPPTGARKPTRKPGAASGAAARKPAPTSPRAGGGKPGGGAARKRP